MSALCFLFGASFGASIGIVAAAVLIAAARNAPVLSPARFTINSRENNGV